MQNGRAQANDRQSDDGDERGDDRQQAPERARTTEMPFDAPLDKIRRHRQQLTENLPD